MLGDALAFLALLGDALASGRGYQTVLERIKTADMSRSEWLAERRKSIGGSEIGAVLGLNSYAGPFSVWANKTGRLPDAEPTEAMIQGTAFEGYVAQRFSERSGLRVERVNYLLRNTEYPHLHANIGRRIVGERAGLECKTASALNTSRFTGGEFPAIYYCQCVAYLAVTGLPRWYLAVLILGRDFKIFQLTTERDAEVPAWCESSVYVGPEEFSAIRDAAADFWRYVETDTEPPADGIAATGEALAALYPESNGESVDLFGCEDLFRRYMEARSQLQEAERAVDEYGNQIKQRLGEYEAGSCGKYAATWKTQSRRSFDVRALQAEHPEIDMTPFCRASTYRRFNVMEV